MRLWFDASGARKLCALGARGWRFCAAHNFTVGRLYELRAQLVVSGRLVGANPRYGVVANRADRYMAIRGALNLVLADRLALPDGSGAVV